MQGLLLTIPAAIRDVGVYDITADGATVRRIAVNGEPSESDLRRRDPDEAAELVEPPVGGFPVVVLESSATRISNDSDEHQRAGIEIWNVFLGLALVFLIVEMLVAKR